MKYIITLICIVYTIICNGQDSDVSKNLLEINYTIDSIKCFNKNNGAINIEILNGTPNFNITLFDNAPWKGGEKLKESGALLSNNYTFDNLKAGKYYVAVNDANEKGNLLTIFISQPELLTFNDFEINSDLIKPNIHGGTLPYNIDWLYNSKMFTQNSFILKDEGTYICIITDKNKCKTIKEKHFFYSNNFEKITHQIIRK